MSLDRQPVEIIEIDLDRCTRTYGSAPCTAALSGATPRKCFNTFATCQDPENYEKGTLTLRYATNLSGLPKGTLIYPALKSVSTNPTWINLGGIGDRTGPLGKRARVKATLQDFADNDTGVDPYQAERRSGAAQFSGVGYDPESLGTHFGKLRARNPHFTGRALRRLTGYVGQALADMVTRHYVMTEFKGPSMSGAVEIEAKDVLDLAENEKATCPPQSNGTLDRALAATGLPVFALLPATVGEEYTASGIATIGSEIVSYTRSGDQVTITERALHGTTAASHSAGDLFQQAVEFTRQPIPDVAKTLLTVYAKVPASVIPDAEWASENTYLGGLQVGAVLPKPVGVTSLLGELALHGVYWYPDEVAQQVKMRANRPVGPGETVPTLSDARNVIAGSLVREDLEEQRITSVILAYGQIDATGGVEDGKNYARAVAVGNAGADVRAHGQTRIYQVYSRWLGANDDNTAQAIAARLANRFEEAPVQVTFKIDAKDRAELAPADLFRLTTRAIQDDTGSGLETEMQVTSIEEHAAGHAVTVTAVKHQFSGRFGYWLDNTLAAADYDSASDADKAFGLYLVDESTPDFGDGTSGFQFF